MTKVSSGGKDTQYNNNLATLNDQPSCQSPYLRGQQREPLWLPAPTEVWRSSTCLQSVGWSPLVSSARLWEGERETEKAIQLAYTTQDWCRLDAHPEKVIDFETCLTMWKSSRWAYTLINKCMDNCALWQMPNGLKREVTSTALPINFEKCTCIDVSPKSVLGY